MFLRKENPDIVKIIEEDKKERQKKEARTLSQGIQASLIVVYCQLHLLSESRLLSVVASLSDRIIRSPQ